MAIHARVKERITHRYVDGWAGEDEWQYLPGKVKFLDMRLVNEGNGYDEGPTHIMWAQLPKGADPKRYARAISASMSGSACRHEYDCCGCRSVSSRAQPAGRRMVRIKVRVSYNY